MEKNIRLNCSRDFQKNNIKFVSYSNKIKPEIEKIHKELNVKSFVRMKSSLKFCVIASGEYDGYVAEPRACEWDIAAGHAILKNAGGEIFTTKLENLCYNKPNLINNSFIAVGSSKIPNKIKILIKKLNYEKFKQWYKKLN